MDQEPHSAPPPSRRRELVARLTSDQLRQLRTVSDGSLPGGYRRLFDRRYPWRPRAHYGMPPTAIAVAVIGALVVACGYEHLAAILMGTVTIAVATVLGLGPDVLLRRNERRDKAIYDACLTVSVPAEDLVDIAEQQPDLGVLIWRAQQALDTLHHSDAWQQKLLTGVMTPATFTDLHFDLVKQIRDLAVERHLLAQAAGRPALADAVRPRQDAVTRRLAEISSSVEQMEAVVAEVVLLDDKLTELRIAEQIFGGRSPVLGEITAAAAATGTLDDALAGIRALREFIDAHQPGYGDER